jgi:4-amino-4-deoxy-L-arabinose transferase-like glycosyltransferase
MAAEERRETPLPSIEPIGNGDSSDDKVEWIWRLVMLGLLCLIFIPFMGSFGLWDPWETHYGEVGRQMLERGDWVSPWWGSHWEDAGGGSEGRHFYSKPVLLLWMMGIGLQVFGFDDWGIRAGVGLIVIVATLMVYVMGRQVWGRRAGVIMALTLGTSPFWAMLGRQAQTDMPYVGLMTIGMCFFMMGVFGRKREEKATKTDYILLFGTYGLVFIPQMQLLWVKFGTWREELPFLMRLGYFGPILVSLYILGVLIVVVTMFRGKPKKKRHIYLLAFYLFIALASLAKGLLGFMLPGGMILVYLLITREWALLKRVELLRGVLLFITVAFPWYIGMLMRHGREYYERFFVHDHLRRLASGVHQTDSGSFEHFIKWLGFGLFPWGSFVPAALARISVGRDVGSRTDGQRARLLLVVWFCLGFALFTLANTKFHHYIFPCVPALAMLVGLFLNDLLSGKVKVFWPLYLSAIVLFVLVGYDLFAEPQNLKNLYTYQYDRLWDSSLTPGFELVLKIVFFVGLVGMLLWISRRPWVRAAALSVTMTCATGLTVWSLDVYMPNLAVDWSQGYLWSTYYSLCTEIEEPESAHELKRYCREPVIAYKLNWRGETYYTQNEVIPIENDTAFSHYVDQNEGRSFYAIMQRGRVSSFRSALRPEMRPGVEEVHTENLKFILVRVLNPEDREAHEEWMLRGGALGPQASSEGTD